MEIIKDIQNAFLPELIIVIFIVLNIILSLFIRKNAYKTAKIITSTGLVFACIAMFFVQLIPEYYAFNGVYLSNIISSLDGENSKFLKSEVKTLKQVFENVYIIPCSTQNVNQTQNIMVIATDDNLNIEEAVEITEDGDEIILTDNYSPVDDLIPKT